MCNKNVNVPVERSVMLHVCQLTRKSFEQFQYQKQGEHSISIIRKGYFHHIWSTCSGGEEKVGQHISLELDQHC